MWFRIIFFLAYLPALVFPQAATDEIQDADPAQSGYLYVYPKTLLYYTAFEALSSSMMTQALLVDQVIMMLTSMPGIIIICTLPLLARLFLEFYGRMGMVQRRSGTQNRWYVIHV
jgi:hypothetical protein